MKIRGQLVKDPKERLMSFTIIDPVSKCWLWTGCVIGKSKLKQYGKIVIGSRTDNTRRTITAHRYSYEVFKNKIPDNKWVLHKCDNPRCINPDHLFLGNRQDNVNDRERKGRNKLPNVKGENHPSVKLNWKIVNEIRKRYINGENATSISKDILIVSRRNISDIVNYKTWKPEPPHD